MTGALESLKNFHFNELLLRRYILLELKKYRGIIFHETEEGYKICRGVDFSFQNWHKVFDKIWAEHSKVSKILILMSSFRAKYILFELKKYREIIFRKTEEGYKIWRGIDFLFENICKKFHKFWPEYTKVSKIFTLMGSLRANYVLFELRK